MWSRAATPRTSTTGSLAAKAASGREAPDQQHMRAMRIAEEKERVWRNPCTFFCVWACGVAKFGYTLFHKWKGRISFSFPKFARAAISFLISARIPTHNFILVCARNLTGNLTNVNFVLYYNIERLEIFQINKGDETYAVESNKQMDTNSYHTRLL